MTMSAEQRVQNLEDLEAIRRLRHEWCAQLDIALESDDANAAASAIAWLRKHLADDFRLTSNLHEPIRSGAEFAERLAGAVADYAMSFHMLSNDLIRPLPTPAGAEAAASGSWYTLAMLTLAGQPLWAASISEELYRKQGDGWLVASMALDYRFVSPHASGWEKERFADPSLCSRVY
ncbi:nuclear transport factor 2 family protein [Devosia sp.]|uniref:nuclear transport factor 2 family protein n=1 Tax=Devosia sp. TaxID=1871048 RepID=UPI002EE03956